jgi:hypothetical protein
LRNCVNPPASPIPVGPASFSFLQPKKSEGRNFTAPEKSADYEYVCTFPGHWIPMRDKMTVLSNGDPARGKWRRRPMQVNAAGHPLGEAAAIDGGIPRCAG